ncbi:MAG: hypothetical protein HUJ96_00330, partial [Marinilabiliaceae bacterium]|nr:hypothetical protein [Marinilabiliaceae bacterium]
EASTVKGYSDLLKEIDDLKEQCDTLIDYYYVYKYGYGYPVVDLGLDSGTLWARYNVGASSIEEGGSYFAWGETTEKETYTEDNSTWHGKLVDYLKEKGVIDDKGNLTAEYDAATANWGENWSMPTFDEIIELKNLESEYKEINNVKGRLFYGKNGNTLFIPFGYRKGSELKDSGAGIWSARAYDALGEDGTGARCLSMDSEDIYWTGYSSRYKGYSVRAVLRTKK